MVVNTKDRTGGNGGAISPNRTQLPTDHDYASAGNKHFRATSHRAYPDMPKL